MPLYFKLKIISSFADNLLLIIREVRTYLIFEFLNKKKFIEVFNQKFRTSKDAQSFEQETN